MADDRCDTESDYDVKRPDTETVAMTLLLPVIKWQKRNVSNLYSKD